MIIFDNDFNVNFNVENSEYINKLKLYAPKIANQKTDVTNKNKNKYWQIYSLFGGSRCGCG